VEVESSYNCPTCDGLAIKLPRRRIGWIKSAGAYAVSEILFWIVLMGILAVGSIFGLFGVLLSAAAALAMYHFLTKQPDRFRCLDCETEYTNNRVNENE